MYLACTGKTPPSYILNTSDIQSNYKSLGQKLCYWVKKTCAAFDTQELPKEASAWYRRKATAASKAGQRKGLPWQGKGGQRRWRKGQILILSSTQTATKQDKSPGVHNNKICKVSNMCTYKLHTLGHYIATIAQFGMINNYSTQIVNHILFPSLFLLIFFFSRENLNTGESNVSMHKQINAKILGAR